VIKTCQCVVTVSIECETTVDVISFEVDTHTSAFNDKLVPFDRHLCKGLYPKHWNRVVSETVYTTTAAIDKR